MEAETVWQMVIREAYDTSGVMAFVGKVIQSCGGYMVCQHDADDRVSTTHCHVMIVAPKISTETLRLWKNAHGFKGAGNSIMATNHNRDDLGKYMLKGDKEKNYRASSYSDEQIQIWVDMWVVTPTKNEITSVPKKKLAGVKTQWEIMEEIIAESRQTPGVWEKFSAITTGPDGIIPEERWHCRNTRRVYDIMLKHLAKNKIRTSVHEMERWYITMMRDEPSVSDSIWRKISNRLL